MNMIEVKTAELIGPALDWAVAYGLNGEPVFLEAFGVRMLGRSITKAAAMGEIKPSTDWGQCGPLIGTYQIAYLRDGADYVAICHESEATGFGPTHLIAACRAIVAAKLGDTVQVPVELLT